MKPMLAITASILSIEPDRMAREIATIEDGVDAIQLDIMDGNFVSNVTYGAEVCTHFNTHLPLDVHLMVADPAAILPSFLAVPVQHVTFHAEAVLSTEERRRILSAIRVGGATTGIAINPGTPLSAIDDVVNEVDMVLCMTVVPGRGGQAFIPSVLDNVRALRAAHPTLSIQVDGGVNEETARQCIAAGADNLVIGSALFREVDRIAFLQRIRALA